MKFPRNVRVFRGQLDISPFVGVLFLLLLFFLLNSALVFVPGIPLELPSSAGWAGARHPTVTVAVDRLGQVYYQNQVTAEADLATQLAAAARQGPLTMVLLADRTVPSETIVRLVTLARQAGIADAILAARPPADPNLPPQFP